MVTRLLGPATRAHDQPAPSDAACPVCGRDGLVESLTITSMPVFSDVLYQSVEDAFNAPTGDICLAGCPDCGLISNTRFEPGRLHGRLAWQRRSHSSPDAARWTRSVATQLAVRHGIAGGHLVDVGAGPGELARTLCQRSACTAQTFEPDTPGHGLLVAKPPADASTPDPADLVICSHVLEYAVDPVGVLEQTGERIQPRGPLERLPVYVEVSDAAFMLHHDAVWDVRYEHALYFDSNALKRTLLSAGYEPTRWGRTHGNRCAWVEAYTSPCHAVVDVTEPDERNLVSAINAFGRRFRERLTRLEDRLSHAETRGAVVLWGADPRCVTFCNLVPTAGNAIVVATSPSQLGKRLPGTGQPVMEPDAIRDLDIAIVVTVDPFSEKHARAWLVQSGIEASVILA